MGGGPAAEGSPFRLVLLDVMMPEMDGDEVTARLRELPDVADTPVIILSSAMQAESQAVRERLAIEASLPKPASASPDRVTWTDRPGISRGDVLLAEDNAVNQRLAVRLLERQGYQVTVAATGREAVALLESREFGVVLMDVQMPEMNGFEATAAVRDRERPTGEHIPIVAMTAHAMAGDREKGLEAGMDDYVSKPIDSASLFAALDRVMMAASGAGEP